METLGSMMAQLTRWFREPIEEDVARDAINDSIESLWESLILANVSLFMDGPSTATLSAGWERADIVTILDPTDSLSISNVSTGAVVIAQHDISATYTLVTESGSETLESPAYSYTVPANNLARFASPAYVDGAIGWNLYAGSVPGRRALQNEMPLRFGDIFDEPAAGFADEPELPSPPTSNTTGDNVFFIRHIDVTTVDGVKKAWNQGDIDSDFMRKAARVISGTSEYTSYAWDLVNQRTLEIRPPLGREFNPNIFYVVRPRRLRYKNAMIPFFSVPAAAFLRCYSLSLVCLSLYEYEASDRWAAKAETERDRLLRAVTAQSHAKDMRVIPFLM